MATEISLAQPPDTTLSVVTYEPTAYNGTIFELQIVPTVGDEPHPSTTLLQVEPTDPDVLWDQLARIPQVRERIARDLAKQVQGVPA